MLFECDIILLSCLDQLQAADTARHLLPHPTKAGHQQEHWHDPSNWSLAIKTVFTIHLVCHACKLGLLSFACSLLQLISIAFRLSWPYYLVVLAGVAVVATSAICIIVQCLNYSTHNKGVQQKYIRPISQGIAAAQTSVLICTDWAAAFYCLAVLVPLLSWPPPFSRFWCRLQTILGLLVLMLVCGACFVILKSLPYRQASIVQDALLEQGHRPKNMNSRLVHLLSWQTIDISACMTLVLPACVANMFG